jgi:hypothetical protein
MKQTLRTRGNMLLAVAVVAAVVTVMGFAGPARAHDNGGIFLDNGSGNGGGTTDSGGGGTTTPGGGTTTPPGGGTTTPPGGGTQGTPTGTPPGGVTQSAPEPATLLTGLLGSGLFGLYAAFRRKRRAVAE